MGSGIYLEVLEVEAEGERGGGVGGRRHGGWPAGDLSAGVPSSEGVGDGGMPAVPFPFVTVWTEVRTEQGTRSERLASEADGTDPCF
jgi:hypothetical protein